MADFKVEKQKLEADRYDDDLREAAGMLNDLIDDLKNNGYRRGRRNNLAVDLSILCYVLELNPLEVGSYYIMKSYENPEIAKNKIADLEGRLSTIARYLADWDNYHIYNFMVMDWENRNDLGYVSYIGD